MTESVESLRSRITELEEEIDGLEGELRRPSNATTTRRITLHDDIPHVPREEVFEEFVSRLRRRFGALGDTEVIGGTMTWTLKINAQAGVSRAIQVTVAPRGSGSRLRYIENMQVAHSQRIAGYSIGLGMLGFGVAAAAASALLGPALVPAALVAPVLTHQLGKRSYRKAEEKRTAEAKILLAELAQAAKEMSATSPQENE